VKWRYSKLPRRHVHARSLSYRGLSKLHKTLLTYRINSSRRSFDLTVPQLLSQRRLVHNKRYHRRFRKMTLNTTQPNPRTPRSGSSAVSRTSSSPLVARLQRLPLPGLRLGWEGECCPTGNEISDQSRMARLTSITFTVFLSTFFARLRWLSTSSWVRSSSSISSRYQRSKSSSSVPSSAMF